MDSQHPEEDDQRRYISTRTTPEKCLRYMTNPTDGWKSIRELLSRNDELKEKLRQLDTDIVKNKNLLKETEEQLAKSEADQANRKRFGTLIEQLRIFVGGDDLTALKATKEIVEAGAMFIENENSEEDYLNQLKLIRQKYGSKLPTRNFEEQ